MGADERLACLWVPDLVLAAVLRSEPELAGEAVGVCGAGARAGILAASEAARRAGVTPGMAVGRARELLPGIAIRELPAAVARSAQAALLDAARAFSPRVARAPGGEVFAGLAGTGVLHAAGERQLGARLAAAAAGLGLGSVRVGIASGLEIARLAARCTQGVTVVAPGDERRFLAPLPLALLEGTAWLDPPLRATLSRFGIQRLGELAALPGKGLGLRLGAGGLRLWRLARGEDRRPFVPEPEPERVLEERDLGWAADRLDALMAELEPLLERLAERLGWRGLSARVLVLGLGLEGGGTDERRLELAAPTRRAASWLELLRAALADRPPRAPVEVLRVEAEPMAVRAGQLEIFAPDQTTGAASGVELDDALARLVALAGEGRVGSPRLRDSHRPDDFELLPFALSRQDDAPRLVQPIAGHRPAASDGPASRLGPSGRETRASAERARDRRADGANAARTGRDALPALRLLRPPWPVRVRLCGLRPLALSGRLSGRVRAAAGPWRLEGQWWAADAWRRDYYEVELGSGGVYRLYRDLDAGSWFVDAICG